MLRIAKVIDKAIEYGGELYIGEVSEQKFTCFGDKFIFKGASPASVIQCINDTIELIVGYIHLGVFSLSLHATNSGGFRRHLKLVSSTQGG